MQQDAILFFDAVSMITIHERDDVVYSKVILTRWVSWYQLHPLRLVLDQFTNLDQPCLMCLNNRYMACVNETCQCPVNTYFDGNICQAQRLSAQLCRNASECRSDLNYTCLPRMQCGRKYIFIVFLSLISVIE